VIGKDISFWQDNWIQNRNLMDLLEIEDHDAVDLELKVSDFIEDKHWNGHKLNLYLRNQDIVQKNFGIPIPISDIKDSFYWGLSSFSVSTTNSATWVARSQLQEDPPWSFKWTWKLDTMPKIKIFLWQIAMMLYQLEEPCSDEDVGLSPNVHYV